MATSRSAARRAPRRAGPERSPQRPTRRLLLLVVVITVAFGAVLVRLAAVQVAGADQYRERGMDQRVREMTLAAERGAIFDRNGLALAVSVPAETVWADPRIIDDPAGYARILAPLVGVEEATLAQRLAKHDKAFVYVARQVDDTVAAAVRALDLPGVDLVAESRRAYPAARLAGPVLGFVGTDNQGLGGLESAYDELLTGTPGRLVVERDPQGREIPGGGRSGSSPERGSDLVLTLDQSTQYEAEQVLTEHVAAAGALGGTAIVLDVHTGDILALATVITDAEGTAPATRTASASGVTDVYEPGSTNKVITVAGAIEDGVVTPETRFSVPATLELGGYTFEDHTPHADAWWSVADIVRESSNVGTIMVGRSLGRERFDHYVRTFGFGSPSGLDYPGESAGIVPPLDQYSDSSMGSIPIGNGLAVTALQMVNVYTTIAAGGLQRAPRLVEATIDADGTRVDAPASRAGEVISAETAAAMTAMLRDVVDHGTGKNAAIPGYPVAGKTGTARKPPYDQRWVASFAGFAPADAPRLAAIVVLDEPSTSIYGGEVAAPAFVRIMQFALRHERIPPSAPVQGSVGRQTMPEDVAVPGVVAGRADTVATSTSNE